MAVGANSYGSAADVAALVPRYTSSGSFLTTTRPTLAQVESWIDSTSATLNVILARSGFAVPISQTDAKAACAAIVTEVVAELCHAANTTGRFFTDKALERGQSPMRVLRQEMADWVEMQAPGLESLGASRTTSLMGGAAYNTDATPIFQRAGFGNTFEDWSGDDAD